jgi:hypothetical protein
MLFSQLLTLHHRGDLTLRSILVCVMFMISLVGSMFLILRLLLSVFRCRLIWRFTFWRFCLRFCILGTRVIFLRFFISVPWHVLGILLWLLIGRHGPFIHCRILLYIGLKISMLWGALWDWWGRTLAPYVLLLFARLDFFFFWNSLSSHSLLHIFTVFLLLFLATLGWISLDLGLISSIYLSSNCYWFNVIGMVS